jgi:hypothetical protein
MSTASGDAAVLGQRLWRIVLRATTCSAAIFSSAACGHGKSTSSALTATTTTTSSAVVPAYGSDAAQRIAAAHCERTDGTCATVFDSRAACMRATTLQATDVMRLERCAVPVDPDRLASCLVVVQRERCDADVTRVDECSARSLCKEGF